MKGFGSGMAAVTEIRKEDFNISSDRDEIRVDGLCRELLRGFHRYLLEKGTDPLEAGTLAHGADYYLRDFIVSSRRRNLFEEAPGLVRRFAATWYIISNLEPSAGELGAMLRGIMEFYRFLHEHELLSDDFMGIVEQECSDSPFYEERIRSFLEIRGDGYLAWERMCGLKDDI